MNKVDFSRESIWRQFGTIIKRKSQSSLSVSITDRYIFFQITDLTRLVFLSALSGSFLYKLVPSVLTKYVLVKFWQSSSSCRFLTYFKNRKFFFNHFMTIFYLHRVHFASPSKIAYLWTLLTLHHIFSTSSSLDSTWS